MKCALLLLAASLASGCSSSYAYFTDQDDLDERAAQEISAATGTIWAAIYSYSVGESNGQAHEALLDAADDLEVLLCVDDAQYDNVSTNMAADVAELGEAGVEVRWSDGLRETGSYPSMHNKYLVLDGRTVLTGSYNYTHNATQNNEENLLVVHDSRLAAQYGEAFLRLWERCETSPIEE